MSDVKARVSTPQDQTIGFFVNPVVENLCDRDYQISGDLVDEEGHLLEKVGFNPEVVPYTVDLCQLSLPALKMLVRVYVQHGLQPVIMTGVAPQ